MKTKNIKEKQTIKRIVYTILQILIGISTACLAIALIPEEVEKNIAHVFLGIASFLVGLFLVQEGKLIEQMRTEKRPWLFGITTILGIGFAMQIPSFLRDTTNQAEVTLYDILAIPAIIVYLYWLYSQLLALWNHYKQTIDKIEKRYLITFAILCSIGIVVLYHITNVFYLPKPMEDAYKANVTIENEKAQDQERDVLIGKVIKELYASVNDDIVYTSDTGTLVRENAYVNINANQNDIRQPLFAVFAMPFCILPNIIANLLPQIPNLYPICIAIIQGVLMSLAFTLLARMMQLKGMRKILFLITMTVTFPSLLFLCNLEQYVFPVFYLIVFVYASLERLPQKDISYIAMTGSLLTSGILLPLLAEKNDWKKSLQNIGMTFLKCVAILLITSRIIFFQPSFFTQKLDDLLNFSEESGYTLTDKLAMYTHFLKNTLLFSEVEVDEEQLAAAGEKFGFDYNEQHIELQLLTPSISQTEPTTFSVIGIGIGVAVLIGFLLNRKDTFSKICFAWTIFSFIVLFVIGWGTSENGLMLYTLYFSWAFVCLLYKCIEAICGKHEKIKNGIYLVALIPMLLINLYGMAQIVQFGMQFFPY